MYVSGYIQLKSTCQQKFSLLLFEGSVDSWQSTIVSPLNPIFHGLDSWLYGFVTSVVGEFGSKRSVVIHESLPQEMPSLR